MAKVVAKRAALVVGWLVAPACAAVPGVQADAESQSSVIPDAAARGAGDVSFASDTSRANERDAWRDGRAGDLAHDLSTDQVGERIPAAPTACTMHVAKNGRDDAPGTKDQPLLTIGKAMDQAKPGDVVCVHAGRYDERPGFKRSGTADARITLRNYPGDPTLPIVYGVWTNYVPPPGEPLGWLDIVGFDLKPPNDAYGIEILESHDILIQGNRATDLEHGGFCNGGYRHVTIDGNFVARTSSYALKGHGRGVTVTNNIFVDNAHAFFEGVPQERQDFSDAFDWLVANNVFVRNGLDFSAAGTAGKAMNLTIANNIFYGDQAVVGVDGSMANKTIAVKKNLFFGAGQTLIAPAAALDVADNMQARDPLFADPAAGDFHLQAGSPAVDAGLSLPAVFGDFAGARRPQGKTWDIGAFER